jgi:hypothetical protein
VFTAKLEHERILASSVVRELYVSTFTDPLCEQAFVIIKNILFVLCVSTHARRCNV